MRKDSSGSVTFLEPESAPVQSSDETPETDGPMVGDDDDVDERRLMWELVKDISNELDVDAVCHKILRNVSALVQADR